MMKDFPLGSDTYLITVAIRVKDREKMIAFYQDILGFDLKREENELAIFGIKEEAGERLWLEESPRANDHGGEIKKMQRISLKIPTLAELGDLLLRLEKAKHPIKNAEYGNGQVSLFVNDPEENQLELFYTKKTGEIAQVIDRDRLVAAATGKQKTLSKEVSFDKVHLNVSDLKQEHYFLENILGLLVHDDDPTSHVLNEGIFHIGLNEGAGGTIDLPTHEVLGLDFLKFAVSEKEFLALEQHLASLSQSYYVDKKKKILTIYDSIGIEWWFVVPK